MFYNHFCFI